ncbi:MAG: aldehyde dehydrogenase family protein [Cyanothece sp. SIO2G6]|nr:aldehyde dehydrogenase family protein [Cyanothece sp. SIO2G6]
MGWASPKKWGIFFHKKLLNSGQTCISAKRYIVRESIAAEFTAKVVARSQPKRSRNILGSELFSPIFQADSLQSNRLNRSIIKAVATNRCRSVEMAFIKAIPTLQTLTKHTILETKHNHG